MADLNPTMGAAIRAARTRLGWTQGDLAERLHVKRASVSLWEGGQVPGPLNLAALREVLGPSFLEPTPTPSDAAYWRGVYYAAEAMSRTVAELLGEARRAAERDPRPEVAAVEDYEARPSAAAETPHRAPKSRRRSAG